MSDLSILSRRALRAEYARARAAFVMPSWYDMLVHGIQNGSAKNRVPWIGGGAGAMSLRLGADAFEKVNAYYVDADPVPYQSGASIDLEDMRNDETGLLNRQLILADLAGQNARHLRTLAKDLIDGGATNESYDSQYYFDTDHKDADGAYTTNQSNKISVDISTMPSIKSGSTTVPSPEDIIWLANYAVQSLVEFRDDKGVYVNEDANEFVCFVPNVIYSAAAAAQAKLQGYGASNPLDAMLTKDSMKIHFVRILGLTWTDRIAVFRVDGGRKPILSVEQTLEPAIALKIYDPETSDMAKSAEAFYALSRANRVSVLGDWRNAIMAIMT